MDVKIFVDTSAWLAYSIPTDPRHRDLLKLFKQTSISHSLFYTSNDIVNETYTRFRYDSGWPYAQKYIEYISLTQKSKLLTQLWTNEQIQLDAFSLLCKYSDHKLSFTDATSAVIMKKFRIKTIFTLDSKHFSTLGFQVLPN